MKKLIKGFVTLRDSDSIESIVSSIKNKLMSSYGFKGFSSDYMDGADRVDAKIEIIVDIKEK